MGLLDSMASQVLGSLGNAGQGGAAPAGALEAVGGLLAHPEVGGVSGLVQSFERQGLGGVVASWICSGQNLPISAEQIQAVLGSAPVQALAAKLGFSTEQASALLAQWLPQIVDQLTPGGQVAATDGGALEGMLGGLLKRGLG